METGSIQTGGTKREYNLGWALLRPFLCFLVILEHFWVHNTPIDKPWQEPFEMLLGVSVPAFMFMSFYLIERHLSAGDTHYLQRRTWRIVWPMVGWALIYFVAYLFLAERFNIATPELADLPWQVVTGHSPRLNPSMWYQLTMLILTLLLFLIIRLVPRRILLSVSVLMVASLLMIWTGLNDSAFGWMRFELKYPLGRIAEMAPFAVLGYAASRYDLLERSRHHSRWLFPLFLSLTVVSVALLQDDKMHGFGYSSLFYPVTGICLVLAFWYAPLRHTPLRVQKVLLYLCSCTLGIYCIHRLVYYLTRQVVLASGVDIGFFSTCILTYIAAFLICRLLAIIPYKPIQDLVK